MLGAEVLVPHLVGPVLGVEHDLVERRVGHDLTGVGALGSRPNSLSVISLMRSTLAPIFLRTISVTPPSSLRRALSRCRGDKTVCDLAIAICCAVANASCALSVNLSNFIVSPRSCLSFSEILSNEPYGANAVPDQPEPIRHYAAKVSVRLSAVSNVPIWQVYVRHLPLSFVLGPQGHGGQRPYRVPAITRPIAVPDRSKCHKSLQIKGMDASDRLLTVATRWDTIPESGACSSVG